MKSFRFRSTPRAVVAVGFLCTTLWSASGVTFPGSGGGAIPDGTGGPGNFGPPLLITFNVQGAVAPIGAMSIDITLTHTWAGDLRFVLRAPNGIEHILASRIGATNGNLFGFGADFNGTYTFTDATNASLWSAAACGFCVIPSGSYYTTAAGGSGQTDPPPSTSLVAAFGGLPAAQINGTWTLSISDGTIQDTGLVTSATLTLPPRLVTHTGDAGSNSLRHIIVNSPPGETIAFAPSVTGTITLTNGELVIDRNLTLLGPGPKLMAIDGNNSNRVFNVNSGIVKISGLTVTNGRANTGGGIFNDSTLALSNCAIVGNVAQTIGGGGIRNRGALTIWNSAITGNLATNDNSFLYAAGGGILNDSTGATVLVNCTLARNHAVGFGTDAFGGGIFNASGFSITNCTIAGNLSSGSGGGFAVFSGVPVVASSIIADNAASNSAPDVFGPFDSGGYNLIGKTNGSSGFTPGKDLTGTVSSPLNPLLLPLADYGGLTLTHALLAGSPAIDAGKSPGLIIDQRGAPRPYDFTTLTNATGGDASDIGAYESARPMLNIEPTPPVGTVITWPAYYGGFTLESTPVLPASNWTAVIGTPPVVSNQFRSTNTTGGSNRFFRLRGN